MGQRGEGEKTDGGSKGALAAGREGRWKGRGGRDAGAPQQWSEVEDASAAAEEREGQAGPFGTSTDPSRSGSALVCESQNSPFPRGGC